MSGSQLGSQKKEVVDKSSTSEKNPYSAPSINLPKGGGAIRGIGEKFAANPATGTGSMTVPIATSPGRSGFGPQLSLSYNSGAGNGPFGLGWNLSLASITRKTDKGLPKYQDLKESDVFILSGAEDLVPVLKQDTDGNWLPEAGSRTMDGKKYDIKLYRPRIEGLFARIERWTNQADPKDIFWRSISKDNITTWYGKTGKSRIADPTEKSRIFSWLVCESYDDRGNVILYEYTEENSANVDLSLVNERNRKDGFPSANRYLKRIKYGNLPSRLVEPDLSRMSWLFEAVFDYAEGHYQELPADGTGRRFVQAINKLTDEEKKWLVRKDPVSSYRAGFEVRTYRLCRRVLMFHHFPGELGTDDYLVGSTEFEYTDFDYSKPHTIEEELAHKGSTRFASFITKITRSGYVLQSDGKYLKKSLPPLEFTYSKAEIDETVCLIDPESIENLPIGLDGSAYRWVDLDGEGLSGVLTEQGNAWFYKRNLGGKFGPIELVATNPSIAALNSRKHQLLDLTGDGRLELIDFQGPMPGFYERTDDENWEQFKPFSAIPAINWNDPNLKFIDLTGDGHADILITEDAAFAWYPSLAEEGFGPAQRTCQALEEENGPRLIFADATQSIYLTDMSGDGLSDIVRIRNGEVCYWPNLGYGHFGAKVTMDNAPWFDYPDQFDQKRIRLADIDGSGVTDIIYLGSDGVRLYFNQSGNRWSDSRLLRQFPGIDSLSSVIVVDLLGNGTACLVWSSPLPGNTRQPMHYIKLLREKPHLLVKTRNNLGAETEISYAPSTKFYLADRQAGRPWITKLPFPVHCVEKVMFRDRWRKTEFTTRYTYHHGYFDGKEREFRGFGRVEQVDVESYGVFAAGNAASPYITQDQMLYQPPVKTITWFHTGAAIDRNKILSQFEDEYFPNWIEAADPDRANLGTFREKRLPEPEIEADTPLTADEWREALRACKGMVLRQEIYELDVDALGGGQSADVLVRLFSAAAHNCHIRRLQPQGPNLHAVFLVTESEAISYHYELDLKANQLTPDPRIAHTLTLRTDEFGNILQSVAAVYPRLVEYEDQSLAPDQLSKIRAVQGERHLIYAETRYTDDEVGADTHRLRMPCAMRTYELTGITSTAGVYFDIEYLRGFRLSARLQNEGTPVVALAYHEQPTGNGPHKRMVEHAITLYFKDDLTGPLDLGKHGTRGLTYETYKLALTDSLFSAVFGAVKLTPDVLARARDNAKSGYLYLANTAAVQVFGGEAAIGQYWICSGTAGFEQDAAAHFYMPERYTDPFGNTTTLSYDGKYDLYIQSSTDAHGNTTNVERFDYRVLAPGAIKDLNDNLTEAYFDALGMVAAMALKGKGNEGDNLDGFDDDLANSSLTELVQFFFESNYDEGRPRRWLANATERHVYYFGETLDANGNIVCGTRPARACGIQRERHVAQLASGEESLLHVAFECSDGSGNVLMKKSQSEPDTHGGPLRWIVSGKTVLNNKGRPVKQYEPYFSVDGHRCEEPKEEGVTPVMYYDAAGRLVRTEMPDGTFSRVEFTPWHVRSFDANDTVLESRWYVERGSPDPNGPRPTGPDGRAAWLAAQHAETPAETHLDALGREVIAIAHNRVKDSAGNWQDEKYLTFTKLDSEGKPLWIRDARGNLVMQYIAPARLNNDPSDEMPVNAVPCYDIAGNLLFQHSMDAGDRWMLMDAAGKPMLAWDTDETPQGAATTREDRFYLTEYDSLHRPTAQWLSVNGATGKKVERYEYQDAQPNDVNNLNGQLIRHYDPSGLLETIRREFKGNVQEVWRKLNNAPTEALIDWQSNPAAKLENEIFIRITEYDALNRMTRLYNWHQIGGAPAVYKPAYNRRGLLERETLTIRGAETTAIDTIRYNVKGQKRYLKLGNGTITRYEYDPNTFRLVQLRTTRPNQDPAFPGTHANLSNPYILQQLIYTYDPVGNITEIYDEAYKPAFFANAVVEPRSRYEYDALYRLVSATGRENGNNVGAPGQFERPEEVGSFPAIPADALCNYTQTYQYDGVGNIKRMRHQPSSATGGWTRNYAYADDSNRLLRTWEGDQDWDSGNATNKTIYGYDTHGNMLNLAQTNPRFDLRWDYRDMIRSIDLGGGGMAYYQYDAGKQRTRKRIVNQNGTGYWERIYLGGFERYRRYVGTTLKEEIESHHLFEGEQRLLWVDDVIVTDKTHADGRAYQTGPIYRYQYSNHLGSASLELDHSAGIISYEEYHPYGTSAYHAVRRDTEAPPKRYRYTGMERDEESGLSYHTARYYSPWLGRWVSCDPSMVADGDNIYRYCLNNPVVNNDPMGRQTSSVHLDPDIHSVRLLDSPETTEQVLPETPEQEDGWDKWAALPEVYKFAFPFGAYDTFIDRNTAGNYVEAMKHYTSAESVMLSPLEKAGEYIKGAAWHLSYIPWGAAYFLEHAAGSVLEGVGQGMSAIDRVVPGFTTSVEAWAVSNPYPDPADAMMLSVRMTAQRLPLLAMRARALKSAFTTSTGGLVTFQEAVGIWKGIRLMERNDYMLSIYQFKYSGNQGLDVFFRGVGPNMSDAFLSAKRAGGSAPTLKLFERYSFGSLQGTKLSLRDGGSLYLGSRLQTYIERGGMHARLADDLIGRIGTPSLKSYGNLGDKLYEFRFFRDVDFNKARSAARLIDQL